MIVVVTMLVVMIMAMLVIVVMIMPVIANTGILKDVASRAIGKIHSEFLKYSFIAFFNFDLNNYRKVISLRKGFIRDECVTLFFKSHPDRVASAACGDAYHLIGKFGFFIVFTESNDFNFPVFEHFQFEVWFDLHQNTTSIRAGDLLCVVMSVMIVAVMIVAVMLVAVMLVVFIGSNWY